MDRQLLASCCISCGADRSLTPVDGLSTPIADSQLLCSWQPAIQLESSAAAMAALLRAAQEMNDESLTDVVETLRAALNKSFSATQTAKDATI